MKNICYDLAKEYEELDSIVKNLSSREWQLVTPFYGWTIKDELSHIAYFDEAGVLSATDKEAFQKHFDTMVEGINTIEALHKRVNFVGNNKSDEELLEWWRKERTALVAAYEKSDPKTRLPWYGPTMSARASASARILEVWAHGQDIYDTLGIIRKGTDRLKHIAHIGFITFQWTFINRGLEPPIEKVRLELNSPNGELWTWGDSDAEGVITGEALDFCLVTTQRRNIQDTCLNLSGEIAEKWMEIAQSFAGPPDDGPTPGARSIEATDKEPCFTN